MKLATYTTKSTLKDLEYVNQVVRKVKSRNSVIIFEKIAELDNLLIHGIGDASLKHGERKIGGQLSFLGQKILTEF